MFPNVAAHQPPAQENEGPMIAYFASDLVWATRIRATAESLGIASRPVRSLEMLEARLADSNVRALIVDLDDPETAMALIRRARMYGNPEDPGGTGGAPNPSRPPTKGSARIRVAAFGPHVNAEAFGEAREAGADLLLTRGQFHAELITVLRELEADGEG